MLENMMTVVLQILKGLAVAIVSYILLNLCIILLKYRKIGIAKGIKETKFIKPVDFAKWVIIDILRGKDKLKLFGIWAFTGYYGEGKTMGCVNFAKSLQTKYPHRDIKIYSNIMVEGQVKRVESWEEVLSLPKNSIFIYDESQSDWSCNNRDFPEDLLRQITQCRKRQLAMFMTSPVFTRMNINIRESVNFVVVCHNIMGADRWFTYDFYRREEYEAHMESKLKLRMNRLFRESLIATDDVYKQYDTVEEVKTIKKIQPRDKTEQIRSEYELKIRTLESKLKTS